MKITISSATGFFSNSNNSTSVIVLPEGTSEESITKVSAQSPTSLIAGAYTKEANGRKECYGTLYKNSVRVLNYQKIGVCGINNTVSGSLFQNYSLLKYHVNKRC